LDSSLLVKPSASQYLLPFNIANIDDLFLGFTAGDFAVLHGTSPILSLSFLLSVRAQLPFQLGGLETNVIFVDGGNSFRLYDVTRLAQLHQLDPKQVLERIYISRAFTAHQMTSIVFEKLEDTVEKYDSKLVIISDIAELYSDKDIPSREAQSVFNQVTAYLSQFTQENHLILIATYLPRYYSKRNVLFKASLCGRANVVISIRPSKFGQQFVLEKHPSFSLGHAEFPSQKLTLSKFTETFGQWEKLSNPTVSH